ncbi:MAG: response regulator transcription factor [Spirochaetes bacterium]|nr:response regulator transcription factor [Spirochaetota bacterium]
MKEKVVNIFVVDDHPIVVDGLKLLLENEKDLFICGFATDAAQALEKIEKLNPDLIIVDISLKGSMNGIELIKSLKSLYPDLLIITLSMYDESLYAERAIRAGSKGYIMKQEMTNTIINAIRKVLEGKIYLSDNISMNLLDIYMSGKVKKNKDIISSLTDREFEIFQLIGNGHKTRDIAKSLNLSVKTIETYKLRIKEKINISSSPELTKFAIEWVNKK